MESYLRVQFHSDLRILSIPSPDKSAELLLGVLSEVRGHSRIHEIKTLYSGGRGYQLILGNLKLRIMLATDLGADVRS